MSGEIRNYEGIAYKAAEVALSQFDTYWTANGPLAFTPDGATIASAYFDCSAGEYGVKGWGTETGSESFRFSGHPGSIRSISFSPKGTVLATASWDSTIKLWDTQTHQVLAIIEPLNPTEWLTVTPEGRFDTNKAWDDLGTTHWSLADSRLKITPLEIFMRDYYEPKLSDRILAADRFKPIRDLSELNRTQAEVKITDIRYVANSSSAEVTVSIADTASLFQKDRSGRPLHSGAYDLRLFPQWPVGGLCAARGGTTDTRPSG